MMNAMEMRQKVLAVQGQIDAVVELATNEKRSELTGEELVHVRNLSAERDRLMEQVDVLESRERVGRLLNASAGTMVGATGGGGETRKTAVRQSYEYRQALAMASVVGRDKLSAGERSALENGLQEQAAYRAAYWGYMRGGFDELNDEQRRELRGGFTAATPEMRAQSVGIPTAGGYLVPDETQLAVVDAMKAYGGMLGVAQILTTNTGADIPIPTNDDTSNTGEQVGENAAASEGDLTVGQKMLSTYLFSTKMVKASIALMQDAPAWFEGWLVGKLAERLARILNTKWTTGTGAATIEGVVTGATSGKTTASATAITWDELVDLEHAVDPAYRLGARWMMHDNVMAYLEKVKNGDGQPMFFGQLYSGPGTPATIKGYPVTINQDMGSTVTTGVKTVLFGNFRNYICRNVAGLVTLRLVERYAEYGQVAFLGFSRHGGLLIDAGTNPIKYMAQL